MSDTTYRKKLIEVALPLEAINREAAAQKRKAPKGYPTSLHRWWAQRPLAACRAVLFAQLVDDPSARPERFPSEEEQDCERQRLFRIIEELVKWESTTNERVLEAAQAEVRSSFPGGATPALLDPFCGGGSIPLEAQRLGLPVIASDLNPVAVLITKALTEIPQPFIGNPPINPETRSGRIEGTWTGTRGLAEDVRHYGSWMRDRAEQVLGEHYPRVVLPDGASAPVIAWLWTRTVTCPNPACKAAMPLVRSFWLAKKRGKEAWVRPVVDTRSKVVSFKIGLGAEGPPDGTVGRTGARCLVCDGPAPLDHVRAEGRAGRMGAQLMAIVAEGNAGRIYLPPTPDQSASADVERPKDVPETELPGNPRDFKTPNYGMTRHADLFTNRQLLTLTTLSTFVQDARERALADGASPVYADALATYLSFAVSRHADYGNALATWREKDAAIRATFARQAIPMVWDFAEANPFEKSSAGFIQACRVIADCIENVPLAEPANVGSADARQPIRSVPGGPIAVCTDPPYYDNIGYADLSDFFYVWLRRSLGGQYGDLFSTLLTPKATELIATPYRHGGDRRVAQSEFEKGFGDAFACLARILTNDVPMTIFYAFKQTERVGNENAATSTGWETMLEGLLNSGLAITGTWPLRTEGDNRALGVGTNALASSIVLVCRPRRAGAGMTDRQGFLRALKAELPAALRDLQKGSIAPVDLAQASIGPGMAVFSRFSKVVESSGEAMRVRPALELINQVLDEVLAEHEGTFDPDTRWAVTWFAQHGLVEGDFGEAETLSKARNTSVTGLERAGIVASRAGKIRLLGIDDLDDDWDPETDDRFTIWEATHHLIRKLSGDGGEPAAAALFALLGGNAAAARDLAYRLFRICEEKKLTQLARAYNALVTAWPDLAILAAAGPVAERQQAMDVGV